MFIQTGCRSDPGLESVLTLVVSNDMAVKCTGNWGNTMASSSTLVICYHTKPVPSFTEKCFYYDSHTAMKSPSEFIHLVFTLCLYSFGSYLVGNRHVKAIEDIEEQ